MSPIGDKSHYAYEPKNDSRVYVCPIYIPSRSIPREYFAVPQIISREISRKVARVAARWLTRETIVKDTVLCHRANDQIRPTTFVFCPENRRRLKNKKKRKKKQNRLPAIKQNVNGIPVGLLGNVCSLYQPAPVSLVVVGASLAYLRRPAFTYRGCPHAR